MASYITNLNYLLEAEDSLGNLVSRYKENLANVSKAQYRDFSTNIKGADWAVPFYGLTTVTDVLIDASAQVTIFLNGDVTGIMAGHLWLENTTLTAMAITCTAGADVRIILMGV